MHRVAQLRNFLLLALASAVFAFAASASVASKNAFHENHLGASLTRVSRGANAKEDAQSSAAYVVAGCGLMSLGLLLGHTRQRSSSGVRGRKR